MKLILLLLPLFVLKCSDTSNLPTQEEDRNTLETLAKEIKLLADQSVCSDEFTCKYVGFGSKACGGFQTYLIYSTSIDTTDLLERVKNYNEEEKKFNEKWGIISDCMVVLPPSEVVCVEGKCKAIYN